MLSDAGVDIRGRFIIDPDFVIRAMETWLLNTFYSVY
jgi:alkyl hydroperoxide reductase subunit AhpC